MDGKKISSATVVLGHDQTGLALGEPTVNAEPTTINGEVCPAGSVVSVAIPGGTEGATYFLRRRAILGDCLSVPTLKGKVTIA